MSSPTPVVYPPPPRRRSLAGPLVLIILGVLFLLGNMHIVSGPALWHWFARFWPLLLILWGGIRLAEYYSDRQHGYPARSIGAGGVLFIIFLIICGLSASTADRVNWQQLGDNFGPDEDNPFAAMFGRTFTFTSSLQQQEFPANGSLLVVSDRGGVTVNSWDENQIKVVVTKKLRANDESEAKKFDQASQPILTVEGNVVKLNANTNGAGANNVRSDLEIWIPAKASVDVNTRHGDITVKQRVGNAKVGTSHGDIDVEDIQGNVDADQRKGDVRIVKVTGDVTLGGQVNDSTITDVSGVVRLNGDFFGGMNLSRVAKGLSFRSSRTDLEIGRLDGDMTMESGDLRANQLAGPMRILTRSKDIHLEDFSGDLRVEDSNANVEVHTLKLGAVELQNQSGDVQIVVPAKANFQVEARTRNGDISSDFSEIASKTTNNETRADGSVGAGGPRIQITNEHGNIEIRKASQT